MQEGKMPGLLVLKDLQYIFSCTMFAATCQRYVIVENTLQDDYYDRYFEENFQEKSVTVGDM